MKDGSGTFLAALAKIGVFVAAILALLVLLSTLSNTSEINVLAGEQAIFNVSRIVDIAYVEVVLSTPTDVQFSDKPPQHNLTAITQETDTVLSYGGSFGVTPRTFDRVNFYWNSDTCQFVDPLTLTVNFREYQVNCSGGTTAHPFYYPQSDGSLVPLLSFDSPSDITFLLKSNVQQSVKTHIKTVNYLRRYFFNSSHAIRSPFGSEPIKYPVNTPNVYGVVNAATNLKVQLRVRVTFWGSLQTIVYGFLGGLAAIVGFFLLMAGLMGGLLAIGPIFASLILCVAIVIVIIGIWNSTKNTPTPLPPPQDKVVDHDEEEVVSKV